MLFLHLPAGTPATAPSVAGTELTSRALSISSATALAFERVLLAPDPLECAHDLAGALLADGNAASWALRVAELRLGRTVNRIEEGATWLCGCLERELSDALDTDSVVVAPNEIEARLPLLVARLATCRRQAEDFDRRLEHEKLESLKELAYGASHEINNPLANIAARAQMLLDEEEDPDRRRKLTAIHRQAMRAHEMISDLMLFARPPKLRLARLALQPLVEQVIDEHRDFSGELSIDLTFEATNGPLHVSADGTQLAVAVAAIVKNAIEAAGNGGHVRVFVRPVAAATSKEFWAEIVVRDDGPGLSAESRRHLFDPFYSGREAGRGLGFGASKCWRIVTDHGGQVVVSSPANAGAEIAIRLPLLR